MSINNDLLARVRDAISDFPDGYSQSLIGYFEDDIPHTHRVVINPLITEDDGDYPNCDTACCVAGWAVFINGQKDIDLYEDVVVTDVVTSTQGLLGHAEEMLGLTSREAMELFSMRWPHQWVLDMEIGVPLTVPDYGGTFEPNPDAACDVIDHIIKHGFSDRRGGT